MPFPVHVGLCNSLPSKIKDAVWSRSFCLILNSYVKEKVPWYGTRFFKTLVMIVVIIIAIVSFQHYLIGLAAAGGAAVEAGAVVGSMAVMMAELAFTLEAFAIGLLVSAAATLVSHMLGPQGSFIAVIVMIAVAVLSKNFSALASTLETIQVTAADLIQFSIAILKETGNVLADMVLDVVDEMDTFRLYAEDKMSDLDKAMQLLDSRTVLDPMELIHNSKPLLGETASAFRLRINAGMHNPGTQIFDMVHNVCHVLTQPSTFMPNFT